MYGRSQYYRTINASYVSHVVDVVGGQFMLKRMEEAVTEVRRFQSQWTGLDWTMKLLRRSFRFLSGPLWVWGGQ